ncbi:hypothetical protein [Streptomyces sp. NPDC054783]
MAEHLAAGHWGRVASLLHIGAGVPPFRPRIAEAVRDDLRQVAADSPVALVTRASTTG